MWVVKELEVGNCPHNVWGVTVLATSRQGEGSRKKRLPSPVNLMFYNDMLLRGYVRKLASWTSSDNHCSECPSPPSGAFVPETGNNDFANGGTGPECKFACK